MTNTKILIADDSEKLLCALRVQLEARGFEVSTCPDAYTALARAREYQPDVMVLDIRMPAGDGFSVLERMRKIPELCSIPVIFITGYASSQLNLKAEQLGGSALIQKPLSFAALLRSIDAAVRASGRPVGNLLDNPQSTVFEISQDTCDVSGMGVNHADN